MKQKIGIMMILIALTMTGFSQGEKAISGTAIDRITKSLQSKSATQDKNSR